MRQPRMSFQRWTRLHLVPESHMEPRVGPVGTFAELGRESLRWAPAEGPLGLASLLLGRSRSAAPTHPLFLGRQPLPWESVHRVPEAEPYYLTVPA